MYGRWWSGLAVGNERVDKVRARFRARLALFDSIVTGGLACLVRSPRCFERDLRVRVRG